VLITLGLLAAAAVGLNLEDLHRLQSVQEACISPDGARVAYTVEVSDGNGRPRREAWVIGAAGGTATRLADPHGPLMTPRWSPDGRMIAGLSRDGHGMVLGVVRADGGGYRRLADVSGTNHPLPATGEPFAWSPDGTRIVFASAAPGPPSGLAGDPVVVTRYLYKPTTSQPGAAFNDDRRLHLYLVEVASGRVRPLTSGDRYEHSPAWSPSGAEVTFLSNHERDPERVFNDDVFSVSLASGELRRLTTTPSAEYEPQWSPDGRSLALLATQRPLTSSETTMEDTHVWVMDAQGQGRREIGGAVDNRQESLGWSPDGSAVLAMVQEHGSVRLHRFPVAGDGPSVVVPGADEPGVLRSWSVARDGRIAYAWASPEGPAELYVRSGGETRRLTHLNDALLHARAIAPVEAFTFPGADGLPVEAFLTQPIGLAPGSRHPMIVILHGGPHGQQGPAFTSRAQIYAARGWASLMVNYRGSTGYGQAFADAISGDQNGREAKDVLAGVEAALARHAWIDPARLGVEGVSYGGQLTLWLVTQTDRFKAAVSTAGISNLVSFNYMAYYHDYLAVEFGRYPHEGDLMDLLWQRSPLRLVSKVRTPTLLLHGEGDNDVPIAESEQFFIALEDAGVDTAFVRYPREGHGLRETGHVIDGLRRSIAWYESHWPK
jgi:dipeptidyl aminopeptidase/acylaminoacyl peptidase